MGVESRTRSSGRIRRFYDRTAVLTGGRTEGRSAFLSTQPQEASETAASPNATSVEVPSLKFCQSREKVRVVTPSILEALDGKTDDHAAWDVFADWLEEHDDPRAELCRLTLTTEFPNPQLTQDRQRVLTGALQRASAAWFPELETAGLGLVWRQGFVWQATLTPKHAELLLHPAFRFIRELNLTGFEKVEVPPRHQLRTLRCEGAATLPSVPNLDLLVLVQPKEPLKSSVPKGRVLVSDSAAPVHVVPRFGPTDFRSLPADAEEPGSGASDWGCSFKHVGSSLARSNRRLKSCGLCCSEDNVQIFDWLSKFRDERGKSYVFREEIFCRTCGVFTSFELHMED